MLRLRVVLAATLLASGAALPLAAQVPNATRGKVLPGGRSPGKVLRPTPAGRSVVTPQATVTSPGLRAAAKGAGLSLQPFPGGGEAARLAYARTLAQNIDSLTVSLVNLFRGTSGQPTEGATGPTTLSARERDRWARCRDLYWDFTSFGAASQSISVGLSPTSPLYARAAALDAALADVEALVECDNISSMVTAPDRWVPWTDRYTEAAQSFYADWYPHMWEAHEADRAFVVALNAVLPAGQKMPFLPGLPRTPPFAGAAVVH